MAKPIHASQDAIHAEGNSLSRCKHLDKLEFVQKIGRGVVPLPVWLFDFGFVVVAGFQIQDRGEGAAVFVHTLDT